MASLDYESDASPTVIGHDHLALEIQDFQCGVFQYTGYAESSKRRLYCLEEFFGGKVPDHNEARNYDLATFSYDSSRGDIDESR